MIIATSLTLMKTIVGSIHCSHQSSQQKWRYHLHVRPYNGFALCL
jgi:hypothetical protein